MATPFSDVYTYFLANITDYSLLELHNTDLEANMQKWMLGAITNYPNPQTDFSNFDLTLGQFNADLTESEKVILAKSMLIEYLNPFIFDETLLKQTLNSKDYRSYSPAKHLETLQKVKDDLSKEISLTISRQSYSTKKLEEWFGKKK